MLKKHFYQNQKIKKISEFIVIKYKLNKLVNLIDTVYHISSKRNINNALHEMFMRVV